MLPKRGFLPDGISITGIDDEDLGTARDRYHAINELYKHRDLLFCLAIRGHKDAWKSKQHANGKMEPGWFIAGTMLWCKHRTENHTEFLPISYHLPIDMWELCQVQEKMRAPSFDASSSFEAWTRLVACLLATARQEDQTP